MLQDRGIAMHFTGREGKREIEWDREWDWGDGGEAVERKIE